MRNRVLRRRALHLVLLAVAVGACGPYAQLAQKLDVTTQIVGDTWIAAAGASRSEIRVLLVGTLDANGRARFSFSSIPGHTVTTLQGEWRQNAAGETSLRVLHKYTLPDERSVRVLDRYGVSRDDHEYALSLTAVRDGDRLVVTGNDQLAGTYAWLPGALVRLTPDDAACAYAVSSLGIQTSQARIIGFGGAQMRRYERSESFAGTVAGSVRVSLSGFSQITTRIEYSGFSDQGGVVVSGPQITDVDWSGNGHMSGVLAFDLSPIDPTGLTTPAPLAGTIDYGGAGNPADAVQVSSGNPSGGYYISTITGGATERVPALQVTVPETVASCLGLP